MSTVEPAPKPVARPHAISVSGTVTPQEDDEYYVPKDISIVRTSHFRHIFGKVANRVDCYEDLKIHNEAMQNRLLRANKTWFGVSWQGVGGRLGVFNFATDKGRVAPPIQKGKTEADQTRVSTIEVGSAILDFDFHPFKDDVLATGSENAQIRVWKIPSGGIKNLGKNMTDSELTLKGHNHKIVSLDFHPFASNLLLTTSGDLTAKLWDVQAGNELQTLKGFGDLVTSTTWNYDGSVLGTACKDRTVRLFDPRANQVVFECPDVGGTLGSKVEWLGNKDQLAIVGFDKGSERHIQLIDIKYVIQ
jgi:WD40 repeat protein